MENYMEDQAFLRDNKASTIKPRKKKTPPKDPVMMQVPGDGAKKQKAHKASKRSSAVGVPSACQQEDLFPDTEYRCLRRKYLILEEENFGLEKELKEVEHDVRALEEQKLCLLDDLVVLEGLIDPSELQPHGHRLA